MQNSILNKSDFPVGYYNQGNFTTQCTSVKDDSGDDAMKYCEDGTFWDLLDKGGKLEERRVLVSCDAGRKGWNTVMGPLANPDPLGSLWIYAPNSEAKPETFRDKAKAKILFNSGKESASGKPQRLVLKNYPEGHDFHPLGLEIYPSVAGESSNLFVVNHARAKTYIEQFVISPSSPTIATYVRTISSPYFVSPNSLALTSATSFYVTNDHLITRRLPYIGKVLPLIETVLGLPFSFTSHVTLDPNPASPTPILSHQFASYFIPFSNGISISPSGTKVAIASTSLNTILFFTRNTTTNALSRSGQVRLPFSPDNLHYDEDSALIVAGHPHFPTLVQVAGGKEEVAPSWVVSISTIGLKGSSSAEAAAALLEYDLAAPISASTKVPGTRGFETTTLFQSNGTGFSSSTTGFRDASTGALYVTGLYEEGLLVCKP